MKQKYILYFLLLSLHLFAAEVVAQRTVTGQVTESDGTNPVIGAVVEVKGTSTNTVTDIDGKFSVEVANEDAVLIISYLLYDTQEVAVKGQSVVNVVMQENKSELKEIVITGYGTQKRSDISGSVATIKSKDFSEKPNLRVEQLLQGRAAGVQVAQASGSPGSNQTVRIRGTGTINSSDPLYIVDGIAVDGLDYLNPNDIEQINVLKDAASAAIYGARGANGVVLVTTKSGKKGQDGIISFESYYGIQRAAHLIDLLNAEEYATLQNEAYIAAGVKPRPEFANPKALGKGTDWQEAIFQYAPMTSHQLSISKNNSMVSANYFSQDGIVGKDKSNFQRATARFSNSSDINSWLSVGTNIGFTWLKRKGLTENSQYNSPIIRALNMDPVTPVYKADGTYAYSNYADTDIANPVNAIQQTHNNWTTNRLVGSVFSDIKILKNLTFRSTMSTDVTFAVQRNFYPKYDLSSLAISEAPAAEKSVVNSVSIANNTWKNWQFENVLTYHLTAPNHDLTMIAGTTALSNRYDGSGGANTNLPSNNPDDAYISNTIDPISSQSAYHYAVESSLASYFTKANYTFMERWLMSATLRVDGSSKFGKNNRYGYFPSVSLGWIMTKEDFWKLSAVSNLKLRASWGQNGNDRIGDYSFSTVVQNGQNYTFGNSIIYNGSVATRAANPDLKWETSTQTNIGLDAELWQGKWSIVADYYIKKTSDMLYASPIPLTAGTGAPIQNVATAQNKGVELSLTHRGSKGDFGYSFSGNIAFVKSEVTGLGKSGEPIYSAYVQSANNNAAITNVGHPLASFYGYVTDGIFQTSEEVAAHAFQNEGTRPGDIRFKDLDNNGKIDENDRTYIGNPTPDFTYGFNTDFRYKALEINLFWQGVQGNEIFNNTVRYDFSYVNRPSSALERWTGPGTSNTQPRVSLDDPNQNARISNRFIEDGSYFRLKNIQVAYNFPKSWTNKVKLQQLRVYLTGQNMLTWTKYSGFDPEIGVIGGSLEIGVDRGFYPQARTIIGGISIKF